MRAWRPLSQRIFPPVRRVSQHTGCLGKPNLAPRRPRERRRFIHTAGAFARRMRRRAALCRLIRVWLCVKKDTGRWNDAVGGRPDWPSLGQSAWSRPRCMRRRTRWRPRPGTLCARLRCMSGRAISPSPPRAGSFRSRSTSTTPCRTRTSTWPVRCRSHCLPAMCMSWKRAACRRARWSSPMPATLSRIRRRRPPSTMAGSAMAGFNRLHRRPRAICMPRTPRSGWMDSTRMTTSRTSLRVQPYRAQADRLRHGPARP